MQKKLKPQKSKTLSKSTLTNPVTAKSYQLICPETLAPYKNNARKHSPKQIEDLVDSIERFGFVVPILVHSKNNIIAGHGRVEAAIKAGIELVPIVRIDHLSDSEIRAYRIADNRLAELSEWDENILRAELNFLVNAEINAEIDFSATITGFQMGEIDVRLAMSTAEDIDATVKAISEMIQIDPVSVIGDVWVLGNHRILCGDSLKAKNYTILMKGEQARIICSDGPYNCQINGFASGNGKTKHREFKNASGEMTDEQFAEFLFVFISHCVDVVEDGALFYLFMDWRQDHLLKAAAFKAKLKQINLCVWDKGCGSMGSLYRSQHELVLVFKSGTSSHINNVQLGKHGRNRTNVWYHRSANMTKEGRKALQSHPTPKPIPLIMDIILDATLAGDIIVDPFLGSGTSVLAAEKTKRRCFGIDIDPLYVDVAIRRWQSLTGKQAIHAETGLSFAAHENGEHLQDLTARKGGCRVRER